MLSAREANKKTLNNITKCIAEELFKLEDQINDAIKVGKFYVSSKGYLQVETKRLLETLGYKVTVGSQYNEPYYIISWQ